MLSDCLMTCNGLNTGDKGVYESEPSDIAIKEFQEEERQKVHELVDNYVLTLSLAGVIYFLFLSS